MATASFQLIVSLPGYVLQLFWKFNTHVYILENGLKGYFKALWEERATNVHIIGLWPLINWPVIFKCLFYLRECMHINAPIWRSEDSFLLLLSIIWVLCNQIQADELHDKPLYPLDEPHHWHPKSYLHTNLLAWCLFVLFFETFLESILS